MENLCSIPTAMCSTSLSSYLFMTTPTSTSTASPQVTTAATPVIRESDKHLHTSIIDVFFPGFHMMSSVLQAGLGLDLSMYIPIVAAFCAMVWLLVRVYTQSKVLIRDHYMSSLDVRVDDEMYDMLMEWVASQPFSQDSRNFLAQTVIKSVFSTKWRRSDSDSVHFDRNDDVIAQRAKKVKQYKITPSFGSHYFWYKGSFLQFRREKSTSSSKKASESEEISIHSFGRNPAILRTLLDECRQAFFRKDMNKTVIYYAEFDGYSPEWTRGACRVSRSLSSVVLNESVKQSLLQDIGDYLEPSTQNWYSNRGIPYRRGYLLHGPPGTGKSSLSFAIAGYFLLDIYIINLNSAGMTEDKLEALFRRLPTECFVLLEDIDTAGLTHSRQTEDSDSESDISDKDDDELTPEQEAGKVQAHLEKQEKILSSHPCMGHISLSTLLNIIDGVASQEGRILIMTTNYIEKLDKALTRPGRVDMTIKFGLANAEILTKIFQSIYATLENEKDHPSPNERPASAMNTTAVKTSLLNSISPFKSTTDLMRVTEDLEDKIRSDIEFKMQKAREEAAVNLLAKEFATIVPSGRFSPAEIQGYLLEHKRLPEEAIKGAAAWVEKKDTENKKNKNRRKKKIDGMEKSHSTS